MLIFGPGEFEDCLAIGLVLWRWEISEEGPQVLYYAVFC